jgi:stage II sporulation protein D
LAAAGFALAGSTERKPPESPPVAKPGEPVFVINGRGWGHGVGMSQWGANGLARRGTPYTRILTHYYQGTAIGEMPSPKIRVLLAAGKRSLKIASAAEFRVQDAASKVRPLAAGEYVLGPGLKLKPKGAKRRVALPPPLAFLPGEEPLRLDRRYRGTIHVDVVGGRRLRAINVVGLEQYLYGVVPAEVPDDWPAEVLKAQAVAARSYALATRKTGGAFDVYRDVRSQVYRGIDEEEDSTNQAVDETARQVVTYRGRVATTYFHSTSGGRTASIGDAWPGSDPVPYLVSVDDPYDTLSPYHVWGPLVFSAARLDRAVQSPGRLLDARTTLNASNRADLVVGTGTLGQTTVRAADVRRALGLRSTWFRIGVLALPAPAKPLAYGVAGKLTGTARGVGRALLEQRAGTVWRAVGGVQAQPDGSFSVTVRPTASAQYRLTVGSARTPAILVGVAPRIALKPVTDPMQLRGTVRPVLNGSAVEIQRLNGRTWGTVGRATVDERGDFTAQIYVPPGSYRARIPSPGRGLVAGTSSTLVVSG